MLKSMMGKLFIALIISHSFIAHFQENRVFTGAEETKKEEDVPEQKGLGTPVHRGHYKRGMNPGFMARIE